MAKELTIDFNDEVVFQGNTYYPVLQADTTKRKVIMLELVDEEFYQRKEIELEEKLLRLKEDKLREKERLEDEQKRIDDQIAKIEAEKLKISTKK